MTRHVIPERCQEAHATHHHEDGRQDSAGQFLALFDDHGMPFVVARCSLACRSG